MKKILFYCLLLVGLVCVSCQNNDNFDKNVAEDNSDENIIEEIDIEEKSDDNDLANSFFDKGAQALKEGNVNEAIELFNKALEISNDADWIYGDLGRAKQENNDLNGAIECYTKAIELNNNRSVYYEWRAEAYKNLGK